MLDETLRVIGWIGAAQAALLAAALLLRRSAAAADRWLGAGLLVAAAAGALISLSGSGASAPPLEAAEVVSTLAGGPLFAGWIARLVGVVPSRGARLAAFAPSAFWAAVAFVDVERAGDPLAIRWAVLYLMAWSLAAAVLAVRRWPGTGARARGAIGLAIGGAASVHVAQLVRLAAPASSPSHLVSATMGALLVAISFSAIRGARLSLSVGAVPSGGPVSDGAAAELVAAFDRLVHAERLFAESGLTVAAVAGRLGTTPATLSAALNRHAGTSFAERLARLRIDEARRLLADPKLDHLAVEAIGTRAGFGSRSTFFAEFRKRAGSSPAEFRQRFATGRATERPTERPSDRTTERATAAPKATSDASRTS